MTSKTKIVVAVIGAFLLAPLLAGARNAVSVQTLSYLGMSGLPRGLRNNNPGNIRKSTTAWKGKVTPNTDGAFEQFKTFAYGIRAMIKNLWSYQRDGLNTISQIIYRWAPPADSNDTESYVKFVASRTGINRNTSVNLQNRATMSALLRAMAQMENYGGNSEKEAVTIEQFNFAWELAQIGKIGAIYQNVPEIFECSDGTFTTSAGNRSCTRHGGRKSPIPVTTSGSARLHVSDVPLSAILTDTKLFQGREKAYSARSVENIVNDATNGNFVWANLDPITLWRSPDSKLYLLSGHSRFKAFQTLSDMGAVVDGKNFDSIPAKIISVELSKAQRLALESNTLSTKETDIERASYYRRLRQDGTAEKTILEMVKKNEGRNWANIYAYTFLSQSGKTWATLKQFAAGEDQSANMAKALARWIGNARRQYPLTPEHENEIYSWLFETKGYGTGPGQVSNEREFAERLAVFVQKNTYMGEFQTDTPLNILQAQQKSPAEMQFDKAVFELKRDVAQLEIDVKKKISELTARKASRDDLQRIVAPMETALRNKRSELLKLIQRRSEIIEYSKREAALFGVRNHFYI